VSCGDEVYRSSCARYVMGNDLQFVGSLDACSGASSYTVHLLSSKHILTVLRGYVCAGYQQSGGEMNNQQFIYAIVRTRLS